MTDNLLLISIKSESWGWLLGWRKSVTSAFLLKWKEQSEIRSLKNLNKLYDFIRMLDAPKYPKAFIKIRDKKIYFYNAKLSDNKKILNCNLSLYDH